MIPCKHLRTVEGCAYCQLFDAVPFHRERWKDRPAGGEVLAQAAKPKLSIAELVELRRR